MMIKISYDLNINLNPLKIYLTKDKIIIHHKNLKKSVSQ
jgi:hypothetical protein